MFFPVDSSTDVEVKSNASKLDFHESFSTDRFSHISNFWRLLRVIARILLLCLSVKRSLRMGDLFRAQLAIVTCIQREFFDHVFTFLSTKTFPKRDPLRALNLFVDENGIIRVGGRMKYLSSASDDVKFPILLPKDSFFSILVVRNAHEQVKHQGRGFTMNQIRQNGFYIIGAHRLVSRLIFHCVSCRRLRGPYSIQRMADLPSERVNQSAPFDFVGIDFFGPFSVKYRRSLIKNYGCLFTCFYSRAVHVEVCHDLSSDSFIMALRRFIAIRGPVKKIFCDQRTNLVGAANEFENELKAIKQDEVKDFLLKNNCDI